MPLIATIVAVYASGLLLGFAGYVWTTAGAALAIVIWGIHTRRSILIGLGMLLLGGDWVARAAADDDARCRAALAAGDSVTVVVGVDAAPGSFVGASPVACHAALSLAVTQGSAPAGSYAHARGTIVSTNRGLVVQRAVLGGVRRGPWLARWRAGAGRRVDALFGIDAPLARALLVADRSGIPSEMRNRYAAAGLSHMLSISGLHVALIAMAVELVLAVVRVPRRRAGLITLAVVGSYVAMLGAPSPALRAAVMLGVYVLSRRWQRPTSPWAVLAIGAVLPLAGDPRAVTGVGYQLSVAGVAALIGAAHLARRWQWLARRRGAVRAVATTMLASTMATVVTAPLVAWNFGRLSLIGPLSNVAAGPIMGLAQPMMFVALALSPIPRVARWFADGAHPLLRAFDAVASAAAAVPGGAVAVAPSALSAACGVVFAVALVCACVSRFPGGALLVAAASLAAIAWAPLAPGASGRTELHMIDVGQGNAFALRTAAGHWVLFDAGRAWTGGDDARSTIVPYIAHRGGSLTAFVLTAPLADNIGGVPTVLRALRPRYYYDGVTGRASAAYLTSLRQARRDDVLWRRVRAGDSLVVDEATVMFLAPDRVTTDGRRGAQASVVALVRVGAVRFLIAGDVGAAEETWLDAHAARFLRADVLQVARHGSAAASTDAFLRAVAPRVALLSVGAMDGHGLPDIGVIERLAAGGAQVLRTDQLSSVVISTDGRSVRVSAAGSSWPAPVRPPPAPPMQPPPPR